MKRVLIVQSLFFLFHICGSLDTKTVRGYMGMGTYGKLHGGNSTVGLPRPIANCSSDTNTFTSGYLRANTFNSPNGKWIRAQVWVIGSCFKEGNRGGSAKVAQVTHSSHAVGLTCVYDDPDCSGDYFLVSFAHPVEQGTDQSVTKISHVPAIETALQIDAGRSDGLIITSYYTSKGCIGRAVQYDLFSTDHCIFYDDTFKAYGTFQCDAEANTMVLTLFTTCQPTSDDYDGSSSEFTSEMSHELDYDNSVEADIYKQPFKCTKAGANGDPFPTYQTVRCVVKGTPYEPPDLDDYYM